MRAERKVGRRQACKSVARGRTTAPPGSVSVRGLGGKVPRGPAHVAYVPRVSRRGLMYRTHRDSASLAPGPGAHSTTIGILGWAEPREALVSPDGRPQEWCQGPRITKHRKEKGQPPAALAKCPQPRDGGTGGGGGDTGTHVGDQSRTELLLEGRDPRFEPGHL